MRIISKFKDYYDNISYIYGQDNKIIYTRNLVNLNDIILNKEFNIIPNIDVNLFTCYVSNFSYDFLWIVICGKRFIIYKPYLGSDWTLFDNQKLLEKIPKHKHFFYRTRNEDYTQFNEQVLKVNFIAQSPICVVNVPNFRKPLAYINGSPILGDISGFVKKYPSEQIYQDISNFFLNYINGSPDLIPPVEVEDKYKIQGHGFDKQSFRHRTKD